MVDGGVLGVGRRVYWLCMRKTNFTIFMIQDETFALNRICSTKMTFSPLWQLGNEFYSFKIYNFRSFFSNAKIKRRLFKIRL